MATIDSLLSLPDEEFEKLSKEKILELWAPCFDLEKKLLLEGLSEDGEEEPSSGEVAFKSKKAASLKEKKKTKLDKMQLMLAELLEQQKKLEEGTKL